MYKKNLIIAGLIALSLHAALVMAPTVTSEPEVIFKKGESSLKMHLIPSAASVASTKSINDIQKDVNQAEEQTIEDHKPLRKPEITKKEFTQNQGENPSFSSHFEQKEKGLAATSKKVLFDNEQLQNQQTDISTINSKEIIADVKEKGVVMGAVIKDVFKPFYPSSCKRRGHEGTTVLEVTILSNGTCGNVNIINTAGCKSLDNAALQALKKADFIPAMRLGAPFTTTKKIAFNFKLEDYK